MLYEWLKPLFATSTVHGVVCQRHFPFPPPFISPHRIESVVNRRQYCGWIGHSLSGATSSLCPVCCPCSTTTSDGSSSSPGCTTFVNAHSRQVTFIVRCSLPTITPHNIYVMQNNKYSDYSQIEQYSIVARVPNSSLVMCPVLADAQSIMNESLKEGDSVDTTLAVNTR